ncbi:MAG: hypothetical protein JJT93_00770 [Gammaproteobacteria bacterium]|nr:hypothetical protein [Gammaproteobacteria bacterium]
MAAACLGALLWAGLMLAPLTGLAAVDPETGRWRPGIGDPTVYGWLTVVAYFATAGLIAANLRLAARLGLGRQFWIAVLLFVLALGVNKQLDLQTWFTQVGRDLALTQGWYANRRIVQAAFIASLALGGAVLVRLMRGWIGSAWELYRLCAIGVAVTLVFIVVRASTFHYVDRMLGLDFAGLRINVVLEIGSIALIAAGAWQWRVRMSRREAALAKARRISLWR